ncbi:unnamed protein product [Gulo gulo]|uniref:Uncharacterized protein n=1 Tax=Gulo gulo TaxID=48420 RepID=A0A9X9PWK5_GULGU|nr:unnamed protein product [Gulo gulo]
MGRGRKPQKSLGPAHTGLAGHAEDGVYSVKRVHHSRKFCLGLAPLMAWPVPPTSEKEGVVLVTRRVLLGLEKCIKIPERALNEVVSRHLCEPGGRCGLTALPVPSGRATPGPTPDPMLTPSPGRSAGTACGP